MIAASKMGSEAHHRNAAVIKSLPTCGLWQHLSWKREPGSGARCISRQPGCRRAWQVMRASWFAARKPPGGAKEVPRGLPGGCKAGHLVSINDLHLLAALTMMGPGALVERRMKKRLEPNANLPQSVWRRIAHWRRKNPGRGSPTLPMRSGPWLRVSFARPAEWASSLQRPSAPTDARHPGLGECHARPPQPLMRACLVLPDPRTRRAKVDRAVVSAHRCRTSPWRGDPRRASLLTDVMRRMPTAGRLGLRPH